MERFSSHSQMFVLEELEQRAHLSATLLSAYYPLKPGWEWIYNEVNDGENKTDTVSILSGMVRAHGERAFQLMKDNGDGPGIMLVNVGKSGRVQFHRSHDDSSGLTYNPAFAYPKYAKVGQSSVMDGELDLFSDGGHVKGQYHIDSRVVKIEQVQVAAGTFSTIKIQSSLSIVLRKKVPGGTNTIRGTTTSNLWLAKGIGKVKEIIRTHAVSDIGGKHEVEDNVCKDALRSYTPAT